MRNLAIFIALVFLTSCAQVPKQAAYPLSYQHKMQASEHWNQLAKEVAEKVKLTIENQKGAIFISDSDRSPFGKAMRTLLATEFNHRDLVLTANESNPYKLVWEVQPVFHGADRRNGWGGLPAFILLDIPQSIFLGETDSDYWGSLWPGFCLPRTKPHSEVIVTYELLKNERSLLRDSEIFYVNDADRSHYWEISRTEVATTSLGSVKYTMTTNTFEAIKVP